MLVWREGLPLLPSLYDEGQAGGFDVSVGLYCWTYFAQFKRADYLSRRNALRWVEYSGPYYRFPITSRRISRQHELLLALSLSSLFHIVEYVAPRFHTNSELTAAFQVKRVIDQSLRLFALTIGPVSDDDQHFITYSTVGHPVPRSEPLTFGPPYNAGALSDWHPVEET